MNADLLLDLHLKLGEGPHWDAAREGLFFVDIEAGVVYRYEPGAETLTRWPTGQRTGLVVPVAESKKNVLIAGEDGLFLLDLANGQVERFADPEGEKGGNRFNDGACDTRGNLWAGTMAMPSREGGGAFYRIASTGQVETVLPSVTISNGLDWSPDGTALYYVDTPTGQVDVFDFDPAASTATNRREAFAVPPANGKPDGLCCDSEGNLWVAHWGGYAVRCYEPKTGKEIAKIDVPAPNVTSCCFGGPDLQTLYITTARIGMKEDARAEFPHAGGLFTATPGVAGQTQHAFGPLR